MDDKNDSDSIVASLQGHPIWTAVVEVFDSDRESGDDFDCAIGKIIDSLSDYDDVNVVRLSWRYIVVYSTNKIGLDSFLPIILKGASENDLDNRAVISPTIGPVSNRLSQVSNMQQQLVKLGRWEFNLFPNYYLNGRLVDLT